MSGEFNLLTDAERDSVPTVFRDQVSPGDLLIAGTDAPSTAGLIASMLRGREPGRHAPPAVTLYAKPAEAEIIRHFEAVTLAMNMDIVLHSHPGKDGWNPDEPGILGQRTHKGPFMCHRTRAH
ncbi:MAG: hypothetical protein ACK40I_10660 [Tabrizicola sp.]